MVRAGRDSWMIDDFRQYNGVVIGWLDDKNLKRIKSKEELKPLLKKWSEDEHPEANENQLSNWAGQIWRFLEVIKPGDLLLSYDSHKKEYILGYTKGDYFFKAGRDIYNHRRKVEGWVTVKREQLSNEAQKSLNSMLTIFEVTKYLPEFEALMRGEEYQPEEPEEEERLVASNKFEELLDQSFHMEKHLQDFLADNWDKTDLGREWELYREEGQLLGKEYETGEIGRIDLLAQSKKGLGWLVVELKRGQTEDATIGQVLRYMGWVQENLADETVPVKGLIICQEDTPKLRYALKNANNVDLMLYEVNFTLKAPQT